jgi:hypothetical protein
MLIENHKINVRCAPEEHNKKQEKSIIMLFLFSIATFGALMNNILPHPPGFTGGHSCLVPSELGFRRLYQHLSFPQISTENFRRSNPLNLCAFFP